MCKQRKRNKIKQNNAYSSANNRGAITSWAERDRTGSTCRLQRGKKKKKGKRLRKKKNKSAKKSLLRRKNRSSTCCTSVPSPKHHERRQTDRGVKNKAGQRRSTADIVVPAENRVGERGHSGGRVVATNTGHVATIRCFKGCRCWAIVVARSNRSDCRIGIKFVSIRSM